MFICINYFFSFAILCLNVIQGELLSGEALAKCPSCSLTVLVIFNANDIENLCAIKGNSNTANAKVALKQK